MAPEPGTEIMRQAGALVEKSPQALAQEVDAMALATAGMDGGFISLFTIFVLAIFVGYYVIWNVTPALHSPLMSVTNAISSVIIVGALIAAGPIELSTAKIFGFIAVTLASINIFGGFIVTQRMLKMYKKKAR